MKELVRRLLSQSPRAFGVEATVLILCIFWLDYQAFPRTDLAVLYLLPLLLISWGGGLPAGVAMAVLATIIHDLAEYLSPFTSWPLEYYLKTSLVNFTTFLLLVFLTARLKAAIERERHFAGTDVLTGLDNRFSFYQKAAALLEQSRARAAPVSLAYIDLDNFKQVNDLQGHQTGDAVLTAVGKLLQSRLPASTLAARIGGDEFIILLPGLDQTAALPQIREFQHVLNKTMQSAGWPVSGSIGLVTFHTLPDDVDVLIHAADEVMYEVKKRGKAGILHESYNQGAAEPG